MASDKIVNMSSNFFVLDKYTSSRYLSIYGEDVWRYKYPQIEWAGDNLIVDRCPLHPEITDLSIHKIPLTLHLNTLKLGDFVWTWYSDLLVTEQTKKIFEEEGFTGAEYYPVVIKKVRRKAVTKVNLDLPVLYNLRFNRKKLVKLHPDSGVVVGAQCPLCGMKWRTDYEYLIPDERFWGGEDFFGVEGWRKQIFITKRVADTIIKLNLKPCCIVPVREYRWIEDIVARETATPEWIENMKRLQEDLDKRYEEWKLKNTDGTNKE